jgi:uncharacterized membrane protein YphA (DoxX/SURF4 family)
MASSGSKYQIGLATVIMLVLLRLSIGWHFFSEGLKHYIDRQWSSEGVLRAAKGPLAPLYHSYLPDHGSLQQLEATTADEPAGDAWLTQVSNAWAVYGKKFAKFYHLDDKQQAATDQALQRRQMQLAGWKLEHQEDLDAYLYDRGLLKKTAPMPTAQEIPFQKKRIAESQTKLSGQVKTWFAEVKGIEKDFQDELDSLLTNEQRTMGSFPSEKPALETVDMVMTYGILGIGACLILGLFTRLACLLGAAFLLSVVLMQPFWVHDAQPTFKEWIEMIALLALATTHVGKWGGLDFFLGSICGCCGGQKCTPTNSSNGGQTS